MVEPFARLIERRRADRVSLRGLLGADGHDQGQAAARRARRERHARRGARVAADATFAQLMLQLSLSAATAPVRRVLALGAHADDIEIGCGATLLALTRARPELEVTWVVLGAAGERERRGAGERGSVPRGARRRRGRRPRVPRRLLPVRRRRGEGRLRGAEGRLEPDLIFTHTRARPPPGSPPRLRADVEHVARPPDPRVRDPEVRRRPRRAERLRAAVDEELAREKAAACSETLPEPARQALVRRGALPRADAHSRHGGGSPSGYAEAFTCRKLSLLGRMIFVETADRRRRG